MQVVSFLKRFTSNKTRYAFSLIELMISLITISCITAAFTPVITKKLKNSSVSVALSEVTTKCDKFGSECSLCYSQKCIVCGISCGDFQWKNTATCKCENCSDRGIGCAWCNGSHCTQCHWGYGYDSTTHKCTLCAAGTYSDGTGPCKKCPPGQYQASAGKHYCDTANAGYYVPNEGATEQIQCDYGAFQDAMGQTTCKKCSPGYAQDEKGKTNCKACGSGWYQANEGQRWCATCGVGTYSGAGAQTGCNACPLGQYQDEEHQASCKSCQAGSYQDVIGQTECKNCYIGKWSDAGASSCYACPAGYACDGAGHATQCNPGSFSTGGASGCTACSTIAHCTTCTSTTGECTSCSNGWKPENKVCVLDQCPSAGQYLSSSGCKICEAGYYCPDKRNRYACTGSTYTKTTGQTSCKSCGTFIACGFGGQCAGDCGGGGAGTNSYCWCYGHNGIVNANHTACTDGGDNKGLGLNWWGAVGPIKSCWTCGPTAWSDDVWACHCEANEAYRGSCMAQGQEINKRAGTNYQVIDSKDIVNGQLP